MKICISMTPIVDTVVNVAFKITDNETGEYEFKEIGITIPGTYTQEEGDNAAPDILPELREWKGSTGNFTVRRFQPHHLCG